jgi:signal transduction histidine kinase
LFREATLIEELQSVARIRFKGAGVDVSVVPPGASTREADAFVSLSGGKLLPGWRLALHMNEDALSDEQADKHAAYVWIGTLVIVVMATLALLIARVFRKQMRATRLKNDLLATVSHELKTPLSSMRLLVDTLLDSDTDDPGRLREYLELIAKENARLSRLIDNFLTFSRMERNKERFDRAPVDARQLVATAAASVADRFKAAGCKFDVTVDSNLPQVDVDSDAVITVLLNLLDNAFKYTNQDKHIVLCAFADNGHVCFGVEDNGVGLSRRAAHRVFERFYRVDHELSRSAEGCGLGLNIVRFIVNAHAERSPCEAKLERAARSLLAFRPCRRPERMWMPQPSPSGATRTDPKLRRRNPKCPAQPSLSLKTTPRCSVACATTSSLPVSLSKRPTMAKLVSKRLKIAAPI